MNLLEVRNLKVHFPVKHGLFSTLNAWVKAVDDVSLAVGTGETLGLVGESGCGKTTLGRAIIRLIDPTAGQIFFEEEEISGMAGPELRARRRKLLRMASSRGRRLMSVAPGAPRCVHDRNPATGARVRR